MQNSIQLLCSIMFQFLFVFVYMTALSEEFQLRIIHHNDLHARFEQIRGDGGPCSEDEAREGKCYGGIARIKTIIKETLNEPNPQEIPTIVLNAGDFFFGTAYYAMKKWEITAPMINILPYDVITIGNHDFDDGIQNLVNFINNVKVPVVCCNLDLSTDPRLKLPNLNPSHVLNVKGTKIGVIGSVTPWTMEFAQTENLNILKEIPHIQAEARRFKDSGIQIIILLSHSGFKDDIKIAKAVPELSIIISSHSHTLLHNLEPGKKEPPSTEAIEGEYPYWVKHEECEKEIPIVQAAAFGKYVGKLLAVFDAQGNVTSATGNTILLDSTIPEDEETKEQVEHLLAPLRSQVHAPIAYTRVPLLPVDFIKYGFQSTLANLATDAILDWVVRRADSTGLETWTSSSIVLMNTPGLKHELGKDGLINIVDVIDSFHTGNVLYEATYSGATIKEALEHSLIPKEGEFNFPNFLHFSGLRAVYDLSKPINQRVESIETLCTRCVVPRYEKFDTNHIYTVVLPRYMWKGGQGFHMLRIQSLKGINLRGIQVLDLVRAYIEREKIVYPIWDDRVVVKNVDALSQSRL